MGKKNKMATQGTTPKNLAKDPFDSTGVAANEFETGNVSENPTHAGDLPQTGQEASDAEGQGNGNVPEATSAPKKEMVRRTDEERTKEFVDLTNATEGEYLPYLVKHSLEEGKKGEKPKAVATHVSELFNDYVEGKATLGTGSTSTMFVATPKKNEDGTYDLADYDAMLAKAAADIRIGSSDNFWILMAIESKAGVEKVKARLEAAGIKFGYPRPDRKPIERVHIKDQVALDW